MEEINTNKEEEQQELTVMEAVSGILSAPSETFESVAKGKPRNFWLIPTIIMVVIGLISSYLFMQDNELIGKMMDKQKEKMREKMEESVKAGKMTPEQSKEAVERAEKFMDPNSIFFKITGMAGALFSPFVMLFALCAIYLVIMKILKNDIVFTNLLNVVGLSMIVLAISSIVTVVLSIVMGNLTSVGLALILKPENVGNMLHALLLKLDIFTIWFYVLVAIGLTKVAKIKTVTSYIVVFGVWVIWLAITTALSNVFGG